MPKPREIISMLTSLRLRAKVLLSFTTLLAMSALSMGISYFGFDRVADAVSVYQASNLQASLSGTIDRELVSYQSLTRYYALTGKQEDEAKAAAAESRLGGTIEAAVHATKPSVGAGEIEPLQEDFRLFAKLFEEVRDLTRRNRSLAAEGLTSAGEEIRSKLADLADTAALAGLPTIQATAKDIMTQYLTVATVVGAFIARPDAAAKEDVLVRLKLLETSLVSIYGNNERVTQRLTEIGASLKRYRSSFEAFSGNAQNVEKLGAQMAESAAKMLDGSDRLKSRLSADQEHIEKDVAATIANTERLIAVLGIGGVLVGFVFALLLSGGISRPGRGRFSTGGQ